MSGKKHALTPGHPPPTYRQDPLYWEPFWPNLKAVFKPRWQRKRGWVSPIMVVVFLATTAIGCLIFERGAPLVWLRQWENILPLIAISVVLQPLILILCQVIFPALWAVCRKPRFRECTFVILCGLVAVGLWGAYYWHYGYVTSSHFKLTVAGPWFISHITDYPGVDSSFPVASVILYVYVTNKYYPAMPHDWRMKAAFPNGESLIGYPSDRGIIAFHKSYMSRDCIYGEYWLDTFKPLGGIGNGNTIDAPAEFIFVGVRTETLLSPETILTIEFEGLNETVTRAAPSHLKELALPRDSLY